jgi:hypothetical protein
MMPPRITADVDCKRPEWQHYLDTAIAAGNARSLRGTTPDGLPPGGRWEYRQRAPEGKGRVYLAYIMPSGRMYTIGSVTVEYAQQAVRWRPKPNDVRQFNLDSGPVVVHYDAMALPARIEALEAR